MCIRDSDEHVRASDRLFHCDESPVKQNAIADTGHNGVDYSGCLLYTSDAADERSSVDLGGRRIIKKKKNKNVELRGYIVEHKQTIIKPCDAKPFSDWMRALQTHTAI